ncbi:unnamed protein product [Microthlaspi erraticum]|uniref:Uncharacterized protein n=1 Tax=Microthlaspi erraticum TaxID=1685480 RepID=A0A6D2HUF0_9BRAS|nr:unnamed protein product [Microthlaspi erraticum]
MSKPKANGGIAFKDIETFNKALLGKQLWRMLKQLEALVSRVFRAMYFCKTNPLEAKLGSRLSYAWKSIQAAQNLMKQGIRRVIGNEEDTDIWTDPWISTKPAQAILSLRQAPTKVQQQLSSLLRVKDLHVQGGREWNRELLNRLFSMMPSWVIPLVEVG